MNIQHLKYAVEVERMGSITLAAENLYISQPSLSKAIRELESNLGFSVFERTSRGILPTRKGRLFLDHAYAILKQMSEIEALSAGDEAERQALSLTAPRASYVAEAVVRFAAGLDFQKPVRIHMREADPPHTIEGVSEGSYRLGILHYAVSEETRILDMLHKKKMRSEVVWEYDPVLITSQNSPLAALSAITQADLNHAVEVVSDDIPQEATSPQLYLGGRALELDFLSNLPGAYMWSSPIPATALARQVLVQRKLPGMKPRVCDRLIYASDCRFSGSERAFIDRLFEVKNELAFSL